MLRPVCVGARLAAFALAPIARANAIVPAGLSLPRPLTSYGAEAGGLWGILVQRATAEPLNLVVTAIFVLAIVHTFLAPKIRHQAHRIDERHRALRREKAPEGGPAVGGTPDEVSFGGQILHFFGEVEAVFGIWAVVLAGAIVLVKGPDAAIRYLGQTVNYTEPVFVVIIMALASTRPVLQVAETCLRALAAVGGGKPWAWWLAILVVAPILGSFITEPAAMTIAALLLGKRIYRLDPSRRLKYATLGLLFVNVSVGGTLTDFAAPPILMVAAPWDWNLAYMATHFGWRAVLGILAATGVYFAVFRRELTGLRESPEPKAAAEPPPAPVWVIIVHLAFLAFTVRFSHYPPLCVGGFLFFIAFAQATAHHQKPLDLRNPLLVGFFLAGLVIHGGLQAWWIEPVLRTLGRLPLFFGATALTAFNDNAAITYLATLVPGFSTELKHAVVAGAVTGGGLTVIANAPNPAGQSILQRYFDNEVSPVWLCAAALIPTAILAACLVTA